jgi:Spy/CpxP family protein refolding chaperone
MRSKITVIVAIVLALLLCAAVIGAQRGKQATRPATPPAMGAPGEGWGMGMGMCEQMKKELGLTPDQVTQLQAIRKDFMDSTQSARDDVKAKMKQMLDLWMADPVDATAIKDLASQMDTVRAQIRDSAIDHAISAFNVLTTDQKAKVRDFIKNHPNMGMGMGCGICCSAGMGMGPGMGCGMEPGGKGPGMGCGMGQGKGPGACGGKCQLAK